MLAMGGALVTAHHVDATANSALGALRPAVEPRNRHPYSDVDWATAQQVKGTTHVHCTTQEQLDVILKRGIEFLTLSNYYPSAPWYPLSKMTKNYYRLHHDFPVMVNGQRKDGPFDWNAIVGQWINELPPEIRACIRSRKGEISSVLCRSVFLRHRTPSTTISCTRTGATSGVCT